jgi:endonuclease/exonuclease/phosphatase family metal-dependent hydrolase
MGALGDSDRARERKKFMSTRAIIGRVNADGSDGWAGRYHHWDGYPSGLGQRLYFLWLTHFVGDTAAMTKYLIDDHPAGWSTILTGDFNQPAGFLEYGVEHEGEPPRNDFDAHRKWEEAQGPQCYCHGDRHEEASPLETSEQGADTWCEYAYIFNEKKHVMYIFTHLRGKWYSLASVRYTSNRLPEYWKTLEAKERKLRDKVYGVTEEAEA